MPRGQWLGASYTGQNRVRCPASDRVCEPCVFVHARSFPVLGRPAKAGKQPPNWRNFTVLCEVLDRQPLVVTATKGEKAVIRQWLRRPKGGHWFAAIADSGQKHTVPSASMNPSGARRGRVLFEELELSLPSQDDPRGWPLIDAMSELLTLGATKEGLGGEHSTWHWLRLPAQLSAFEERWGPLRGSPWWTLCLWLAQRDEERAQKIEAARKRAEKARNR